jgi:hypothetical protein
MSKILKAVWAAIIALFKSPKSKKGGESKSELVGTRPDDR